MFAALRIASLSAIQLCRASIVSKIKLAKATLRTSKSCNESSTLADNLAAAHDRRTAVPTADAGNYAAGYTCSATIAFPPPSWLRAFPPLDDNDCSSAPTRAPSSRFVHTPLPGSGKIRAYRLHRGKCVLVDSHAPSRGRRRPNTRSRCECCAPQPRLLFNKRVSCQDLLTDPYFPYSVVQHFVQR